MGMFGWFFGIEDYVSPWLQNPRPAVPADRDAIASVDILDDYSGVLLSSLLVAVDASLAFVGPNTFVAPYNGALSAITPTVVDGYDGYHLVLDKTILYPSDSVHVVRVTGQDAYGNIFDQSFNFRIVRFAKIIGLETNPYEISLDLTFDRPMLQDDNLRSSANYHFDNGMYARKVDFIDGYNVRLWVELFYGNDNFVLTVDQKIKSIDGYSLSTDADSYGIVPFKADATFTNYNGMVRTWHESTIVATDSQRVYLAGTKGIDVFAKLSNSSRFFRWGQIFDEYGIDAMYVANFPSDLVITDTTAPTLDDPVPAPSSFASAYTHISFKVADATTAVEITTLRVYINGRLAFSGGYGGWSTGWSGEINVEYQQLSVEMWPDTYFSTGSIVTVRVIAQDLMGNELDTSYNFSIIIPIGGFGGAPFGGAPFGGV